MPLEVRADSIPARLRDRPRWLNWRYGSEPRASGRLPKEPVCPRTGRLGDATNPSFWVPFQEAIRYYRTHRGAVHGIGYFLDGAEAIVGGDLDGCRDPLTGTLSPWAEEEVRRLDSYAEVSPSGSGIRFLAEGRLPVAGSRHGAVEAYSAGRYLTITGHRLPGVPETLRERQGELDGLVGQVRPREAAGGRPGASGGACRHAGRL
jgi:primase-polymerase (primpol)-like protein